MTRTFCNNRPIVRAFSKDEGGHRDASQAGAVSSSA